jgi:hypothetical protein
MPLDPKTRNNKSHNNLCIQRRTPRKTTQQTVPTITSNQNALQISRLVRQISM